MAYGCDDASLLFAESLWESWGGILLSPSCFLPGTGFRGFFAPEDGFSVNFFLLLFHSVWILSGPQFLFGFGGFFLRRVLSLWVLSVCRHLFSDFNIFRWFGLGFSLLATFVGLLCFG